MAATDFTAALLNDINPTPASSAPPLFSNDFVTIGNEAYFAAHDQAHGTELFKTDGTNVSLVKDIVPGTQSSNPTNLTNVEGTLYFIVTSPTGAESLWSSDGSDAGTKLVRALPGAAAVSDLTAVGDKLFFVVSTATGVSQLWVSDQPQPLTSFGPGQAISSLVDFNQELYFAYNQPGGTSVGKLGISDGTKAHTNLLANPTTAYSSIGQLETVTTTGASGSTQTLFFAASDTGNGDALWEYDGSSFTAVLRMQAQTVTDLTAIGGTLFFLNDATTDLFSVTPGFAPNQITVGKQVADLVDASGTLYFTEMGSKLFAITQAGTASASPPIDQMVTAFGLVPTATINQDIFFVGGDSGLWIADGSPADAMELKTSAASPKQINWSSFLGATAVNTKLVFFATSTSGGGNVQLWETDGTNAAQLPAINNGTGDSTPSYFSAIGQAPSAVNVGGAVYFAANSGSSSGFDLYETNASTANLIQSNLLPTFVPFGLTQVMWNMNNHLVYVDNTNHDGLSTVDPSGSPAELLAGLSGVDAVTQVGTTWYFIASPDGGATFKLYSTDGTTVGTKLVAGANVPASVFGEGLATLGDNKTVYFLAPAPAAAADAEIFAFNGTTASAIKDVGFNASGPSLAASGASLIVTSGASTIWISNGSNGGTQQVSFGSATPPFFVDPESILPVAGGYVFGGPVFDSLGFHDDLWLIDTTTSPPVASVLSTLNFNGSGFTFLNDFERVGNFVTFNVFTSTGTQLWTTDGTANGTKSLQSFSSLFGFAPNDFTSFKGKLYFAADDGTNGSQLWATDGTAAAAVTSINANESTGGFNPSNLTVVGSQLFMAGNDGVHGDEPWVSDGNGTTMAVDIVPGAGGSGPSGFTTLANGQIFLRADDGTDGSEPFILTPVPQQPLLAAAVSGFAETASVAFTHAVATFTDPNGLASTASYSATVNWGDGQSDTNATIGGPDSNGTFTVTDSHTYAQAGNENVSVIVHRSGGFPDSNTVSDTVSVATASANKALAASAVSGFTETAGTSFSHAVATFTDPNGNASTGSYSASVNWGDGQSDNNATITGPDSNGIFTVTDSHTYTAANSGENVSVTVHRSGFPDSNAVSETVVVVSLLPHALDAVYVINPSGTNVIAITAAQGVLVDDTPAGGLTVTAGTVAGANGGSFAFNKDGSFTYTPPANFSGSDNAAYTVQDSQGHTASANVYVLSQHAGVVWKFYESVLNREPDPSGLQYWTNYFNNGGSTGDMAYGFFESDELLNTVLGNYYQQYLLRPLDASGLAYWKGVWHATGGPEQIKAGFADSPEFYSSSGATPDSWIDALYQRILSRTPDPQGKQFWLNYYQQQVAAGTDAGTVRYNIALGFFDSAESFGQDVTGWFNEYLGRNPTGSEQATYVSQMEAGSSDRTIEQAITNLPEYGSNPAQPASGTAAPLPSYYPSAGASSQAAIAAKDALFASLG